MDNKLEKGENFKVEGSLDSNAVSPDAPDKDLSGEFLKESQKDFNAETPSGINPNNESRSSDAKELANEVDNEMKRSSTENGNGVSVSNP